MKKTLFFAATMMASGVFSLFGGTTSLNGSGATFPAPLYQRWAAQFQKEHPAIALNYQGIGSGAGVNNFIKGLTDFCASDVAMTDQEIAKVKEGVIMIPATAGTIVFSYNLPEIPSLTLSREAYVGILLGKITTWNDPAIVKNNPTIAAMKDLPPITVVSRSDGSGTTALLTGHLAAISPEFAQKVGIGRSVKWPVGLSGKGNDGVTSLIKQTRGSFGYMEFGFAKNNQLPMVLLENKAGEFVAPSLGSGAAALATIQLPNNLRDFAYDPVGRDNYPITGFTWIILKKEYPADKKVALQDFMTYTLTTGQLIAPQLGYLPLPANIVQKSKEALAQLK
ncbi:MAG: phosphate ABC transporter substrate-binding protein PstS [Verrucomicrobiae bacterium]|nr:phosphate ABC transporter substrate-binding protein PstS [Verrucomicrobiae bacterium]